MKGALWLFGKYGKSKRKCRLNSSRYFWTIYIAIYHGMIPATITLTIEENDIFTNNKMDMDTYVNEMTAKFISGAESFDNYDKFIENIKKMGAEELVEIQQAALDRYNAR